MEKKYLISDISKILNLSKDTLRYYDKLGIVSPQKSPHNNYRYYSFEDFVVLTYVMLLRDLDIPLSEIKAAIHSSTLSDFKSLLEKQEKVIEDKLYQLNRTQHTLKSFKQDIEVAINTLGKIDICLSPAFVYRPIHTQIDQTYSATLEAMSSYEGINIPTFTVVISKENLFTGTSLTKNKYAMSSVVIDALPTKLLDSCTYVSPKLCLHTVIQSITDVVHTDLNYIQDYLREHNLSICDDIIARTNAFECHLKDPIDYFELWIPIETT